MKRLVFLFCLLFGITAAAQELQNSARYEHFIELRNESDTLRMKQMLDDWGAKDAEYYAAWSNYCSIMAEETEDSSWLGLAVNWIKMGLEEYPDDVLLLLKQPQVLFDNEQFRDALPVLQELEEKGLDDASSWFFSSSIYTMMNDRERARQYLRKMIQEGDEDYRAFAEETLQAFDQDDHMIDSLILVPDHAAIRKFAETEDFQRLVTLPVVVFPNDLAPVLEMVCIIRLGAPDRPAGDGAHKGIQQNLISVEPQTFFRIIGAVKAVAVFRGFDVDTVYHHGKYISDAEFLGKRYFHKRFFLTVMKKQERTGDGLF